jgi:hypothetical protein
MRARVLLLALVVVLAPAGALGPRARPAGADHIDLTAALLTVEDLAGEWTVRAPDVPAVTLGDLCGVVTDPAAAGEPTAVARAAFVLGSGAATLDEAIVELPPDRAGAVLERLAGLLGGCAGEAAAADGPPVRYQVAAMAPPAVGDGSVALRVRLRAGLRVGELHFVAFRRGDVLTVLQYTATGLAFAAVDVDVTEALVRRADEKLAAALGG